jgi:hypothetical protein
MVQYRHIEVTCPSCKEPVPLEVVLEDPAPDGPLYITVRTEDGIRHVGKVT